MPSINGITAFIETHDGPLPEFGDDEFSGGKSCYVPAQSGQQFWLHYIIHKPLPCKAASVEFYVDGQRVDAQFPLPRKNTDQLTVGPVDSTIKSQYGKGMDSEGVEVAWRRELFFALINPIKPIKSRCTAKRSQESSVVSHYGTIDCKIFRSERSPEWAGAVTPDEFQPLSVVTKSLKGGHISHVARLGVKMDASSAKRYCVRSLDPEDAPFAWFKFYYRSRGHLVQKFKFDGLPEISLLAGDQGRLFPQDSSLGRPTSSNLMTPQPSADLHNAVKPRDLAYWVLEANKGADSLDNMIQKLEQELAAADMGDSKQKERVIACHEKIGKLRENSEKLRLRAVQLQNKPDQASRNSLAGAAEDVSVEEAESSEEAEGN